MVVASRTAFSLIHFINSLNLWILYDETALTLRHCAFNCRDNDICGGFLWKATQSPPCILVVDHLAPGAEKASVGQSAGYMMSSYLDGTLGIYEMPLKPRTFAEAKDQCHSHATKLLPHPMSLRDRAMLWFRSGTTAFIAVMREDDGSVIDVNTGTPIPASDLAEFWAAGEPSTDGGQCLAMGDADTLLYAYTSCNASEEFSVFCAW